MGLSITDLPDISQSHLNALAGVDHAIAQLERALSAPRFSYKTADIGYYEMRRDLPYVIHETSIENTFILVNRNYKPIGSNKATATDYVKYEDCVNLHVNLTKEQISSVVCPLHEFGLFGDGKTPWSSRPNAKAYLTRLKSLKLLIQ